MKPLGTVVRLCIRSLRGIASKLGYVIDIKIRKKDKVNADKNKVNLNIGAGDYVIDGFKSLDFYSEHYYPNKQKFLNERVEYDLRNDSIPYEDGVVDNIYISHVIEHIETVHVENFIKDAFRVLSPGGVLRIAGPDGKFLFNVSQFRNGYWQWRNVSFSNKNRYTTDWDDIDQYDFLIRELSTPNCRFYNNKLAGKGLDKGHLKGLSYGDLKATLREGLALRAAHPGDHINIWDFESLKVLGLMVGFSHVIESKQRGSVSSMMQGIQFDKTAPQMSLYVDMVK